jgi:hypothetical protein
MTLSRRNQVGKDFLRELLEEARRDVEREQAKSARLRTLVRAGKVGGLTAGELATASGLAKPSVYEVLRRSDEDPTEGLDEVILAVLVASGPATQDSLVGRLNLPREDIAAAIDRLFAEEAISIGTAGYDPDTMREILIAGPEAEELIRHRLRRSLRGGPERWAAYLAVEKGEADLLLQAAEKHLGKERVALLPATTASGMRGPELGMTFDAANLIGLFNQAAATWNALRVDLALEPAPVQVVAYSPPRRRSTTLEAVVRGIAAADPYLGDAAGRAVDGVTPQINDMTICVRALTEAAWALRRAVDKQVRPAELETGDDAFEELQAVVGLQLDESKEEIQRALASALERATDRLGPFPGGRIGSFRGPEEGPHLVDEVAPTPSDLADIAERAGKALGYAHLATGGKVDALEAIEAILAAPSNEP